MNNQTSKKQNSNFKEALQWIIGTFTIHSINYQLVGGVAANAYGSNG